MPIDIRLAQFETIEPVGLSLRLNWIVLYYSHTYKHYDCADIAVISTGTGMAGEGGVGVGIRRGPKMFP